MPKRRLLGILVGSLLLTLILSSCRGEGELPKSWEDVFGWRDWFFLGVTNEEIIPYLYAILRYAVLIVFVSAVVRMMVDMRELDKMDMLLAKGFVLVMFAAFLLSYKTLTDWLGRLLMPEYMTLDYAIHALNVDDFDFNAERVTSKLIAAIILISVPVLSSMQQGFIIIKALVQMVFAGVSLDLEVIPDTLARAFGWTVFIPVFAFGLFIVEIAQTVFGGLAIATSVINVVFVLVTLVLMYYCYFKLPGKIDYRIDIQAQLENNVDRVSNWFKVREERLRRNKDRGDDSGGTYVIPFPFPPSSGSGSGGNDDLPDPPQNGSGSGLSVSEMFGTKTRSRSQVAEEGEWSDLPEPGPVYIKSSQERPMLTSGKVSLSQNPSDKNTGRDIQITLESDLPEPPSKSERTVEKSTKSSIESKVVVRDGDLPKPPDKVVPRDRGDEVKISNTIEGKLTGDSDLSDLPSRISKSSKSQGGDSKVIVSGSDVELPDPPKKTFVKNVKTEPVVKWDFGDSDDEDLPEPPQKPWEN